MAEGAPVEGSIRWHSGTGKWQQNWFCLKTAASESGTAPSLVYSKARSTPTLGSISLAALHKVTPADGAEVAGWKQEYQGRCVQLEVGGEDGGTASATHYLLADNRGEMLRWMKALSKIKGAQRKESLRATLASVSRSSSTSTATPNRDSTPSSLSPPPESRPRAASQSSSPPAPAASQPETPATNEANARPVSGRARRQAILLDKPLRFDAQADDNPGQDASDAKAKDPAAVGDGGAPAPAATATATATETEQTKALSTAKTKMQELEERRRLIAARASVSISAAPAAGAAATMNAPAADGGGGGGGAEPDNSSAQQRLREMELKAEQRRKQAEELVAKRQAAALMLQQRKAAPRAAPASTNANANPASADNAEKEETETKAEEAEKEAEKEPNGYLGWKARRKNEDEAQHNVQKMLVGELQAKILPKAKQQQQAEAGADSSGGDSADNGGDDEERVEESSELAAAAEATSGERGTGEGDEEAEREKQDEAVTEAREHGEEENEREKRDEEEEQRQKEEEEEEKEKRREEEEEERRAAEEERLRQEEEEEEEKRKREEEKENEEKQLQEKKKAAEEEEEEERKRKAAKEEEEREREREEEERKREERRKAAEEEEERKRKAAKEEEEEEKERQRRREEEAAEARQQAQRKADGDKQKADELEKKEKEREKEKEKTDDDNDKGKATDELLKQRVEEIEEKKKRMFERMRQREKNRRDSGSAGIMSAVAVAAGAPKSESGGEVKPAEETKNEEVKPSGKSESDGGSEEGNEERTKERRQSGLFAKQPPPVGQGQGAQPEPQPSSTMGDAAAESEKKEAMRKMLEMLSKQKAERAEERERLKKMLEERKKKKVEEYARLRSDNQPSPPSAQAGSGTSDTTTAATAVESAAEDQQQQKQRQQQQQQEELRKLKDEMRSIRSTIVLLDRESDTLNERIAQMHVQELQERRERERQAREEQSRLEHAMREELMRAQALEVLLARYVPLHTPHEVRQHEEHVLAETTHNAVLVNLSGILLARGRSHGNWFAHELGRTTLTPSADDSTDQQVDEDDEHVLRLKGGIVVRKHSSASEWDLLALPDGAVMLLDREPSGLNSSAVSLVDQERTEDRETPATPETGGGGDDGGEQVKRVIFNLADAPAEPDHLSPTKKALLVDLRQAVNGIVEHFSAAGSDQQMAALGEETASNKAITRLVRGELSTILARIFDVGFKSWKFFGAYHLWDFLEAYGQQNDSVRELAALGLRNAIKTLNTNVRMTENPNIKFRALICHGLNNKYLDEWLSLLLAHNGLMNKWYNEESLLRDARAGEAVIKSLGRLKNFPFAMDINFEVRPAVVRRIDSERAAAQQSPAPAPVLSVDTAPLLDDEARMRMRGVTGGSAARAAAAAAAAAQVLSAGGGGGVDASNRRQSAWGRPRNSELVVTSEPKKNENENENENEAKATVATTTTATATAKGVTLWGSLWGGEQGQQHTGVDADELKRIDKRRGKERVHRGSSDSEFLDEVPRLERVDEDFKIEIKEIEPGQHDRGSPGVSFFTSFLDLAKSMVDDNDD